jgi:hypothetical protein
VNGCNNLSSFNISSAKQTGRILDKGRARKGRRVQFQPLLSYLIFGPISKCHHLCIGFLTAYTHTSYDTNISVLRAAPSHIQNSPSRTAVDPPTSQTLQSTNIIGTCNAVAYVSHTPAMICPADIISTTFPARVAGNLTQTYRQPLLATFGIAILNTHGMATAIPTRVRRMNFKYFWKRPGYGGPG